MAKTNPAEFVRQVKQESSKVTWPTRKEIGMAGLMVLIITFFLSIFFLLTDWVVSSGVRTILDF